MGMQTIGRYQVEGELGRGGMAIVYLARDPYMKRQVAVKILSGTLIAEPEFLMRFRREAEAIAALEHPYIVPVYDFGEHEQQPYIVMRHMPGGTLEKRLHESGPVSVSEAAAILKRICAALDEAHARGIIHRDIKPANILLDQNGNTFLGDFGIVKMAGDRADLTGTSIVGSYAYISPEQAYGDEAITHHCDIYSLGVVLFEMLAGERPFHADTIPRLIMKHVMDPVPDILKLKPDLPPGIAVVINRAMAKQAADRYETAGKVAEAVAGVSQQIPSRRARRRTTTDRLSAALDALGGEDEPESPPDEAEDG
jgi:serine/threonine protein kinase